MARILVVDDDCLIVRLVRLVLMTDGHEVDTAGNGFDGLRILFDSHPPDAVTLDLNMPEMDGATFLKIASDRGCQVPIIVVSARQLSATRES